MIFNSNHTSLGSTIPMAEGYDCSCGAALALVEGARNDYEMFKAMIGVDYQEMSLRESGYVNEASISALHEAAAGGIFAKIAELVKKLVAKIKSIFHTFIGKMDGLFAKDDALVKKYKAELRTKDNIDNLEVKWAKVKKHVMTEITLPETSPTVESLAKNWKEDTDEIKKDYAKGLGLGNIDWDDFETEFNDACFDDEDTYQLKEIGGISSIISFIEGYKKSFSAMQNKINKVTSNLEKLVKDAETKKDQAGKNDKADQTTLDNATHAYTVASAYQEVVLKEMSCMINAAKKEYKQNRAALTKAITASSSKLKESTYLDAVAEAAEDEVEAVISDALSDEELSDLSAASTNVKDGDVCDCPEKLVYDKVQHYTDNADMDSAQGAVDVDINARTESAIFSKMLY